MSALVDFRTLQAINDLRALAGDVLNDAGDTLPLSGTERPALCTGW